jgi:RNA recognition motif-containing protein
LLKGRCQFKEQISVGVRRQIVSETITRQSAILLVQSSPLGFFGQTNLMNQNRLFVGNLSYKTGENDLQDYFSQAGVVTSVNLMLDRATGKSRGFAFIEFATPEEAGKAVEQFHNKEFQGRQLTVNIARPREERPPRGSDRNLAENSARPE